MRVQVDEANGTLYFRLNESAIVELEEALPGIVLDFDVHGQVLGVEILRLKGRTRAEELKHLRFEII
jgi:uncharacterized protein YuzE